MIEFRLDGKIEVKKYENLYVTANQILKNKLSEYDLNYIDFQIVKYSLSQIITKTELLMGIKILIDKLSEMDNKVDYGISSVDIFGAYGKYLLSYCLKRKILKAKRFGAIRSLVVYYQLNNIELIKYYNKIDRKIYNHVIIVNYLLKTGKASICSTNYPDAFNLLYQLRNKFKNNNGNG